MIRQKLVYLRRKASDFPKGSSLGRLGGRVDQNRPGMATGNGKVAASIFSRGSVGLPDLITTSGKGQHGY